jgi:drug/metabolite transporter (DMT)-like permease
MAGLADKTGSNKVHHPERAGLLFVLAGFSTLSIGDAIVKSMSGLWPAPAIGAARYLVGTLLLAVLLARSEGARALALPRSGLQWVRGIAIACSAMGMFFAVWIMPLAEATTIAFTQPMITAVLAIAVLRERSRPATWIATMIAFVGVLIVLRPNFEAIGWGVLFPLLAATGMAVTIVANRASRSHASVLALQYYMSVVALIVLCGATLAGHASGIDRFALHWPHWSVLARCVVMGFSATLGQFLIFMGTTRAGPGTVAPMAYGQLLAAVAFGWMFFDEAPDAVAMLGAAIIIGAGLFLWYSSRPDRRLSGR